ncbi:MAG: hypothetical protein ACR2F6_13355 [Mycobacteriales bacterium]
MAAQSDAHGSTSRNWCRRARTSTVQARYTGSIRAGVWWTASNPDRRIPGVLTRDDDEWQLDLIGDLPGAVSMSEGLSLAPRTTICGSCRGTRYTLKYCSQRQATQPAWRLGHDERDRVDDQVTSRWAGHVLLENAWVRDTQRFNCAQFEVSGSIPTTTMHHRTRLKPTARTVP